MVDLEIEDPLIKETEVLGEIERNKILETFSNFDWNDMNKKLEEGNPEEFFHSPTMYFKDRENMMEVCFSLLEKAENFKFLASFVRYKTVKGFWGFGEKEKRIVSDRELSFDHCKAMLSDFVNADRKALENRFEGI